eukprot:2301923-Rhodomonas_salina.1
MRHAVRLRTASVSAVCVCASLGMRALALPRPLRACWFALARGAVAAVMRCGLRLMCFVALADSAACLCCAQKEALTTRELLARASAVGLYAGTGVKDGGPGISFFDDS